VPIKIWSWLWRRKKVFLKKVWSHIFFAAVSLRACFSFGCFNSTFLVPDPPFWRVHTLTQRGYRLEISTKGFFMKPNKIICCFFNRREKKLLKSDLGIYTCFVMKRWASIHFWYWHNYIHCWIYSRNFSTQRIFLRWQKRKSQFVAICIFAYVHMNIACNYVCLIQSLRPNISKAKFLPSDGFAVYFAETLPYEQPGLPDGLFSNQKFQFG
jgi:hypothetical protein